TAPYIIGDKVYGMNTVGSMQCYNETTGTVEWTVSICTAMQSNSFEYHDGYFYVESTNFTMHKVDVTDGSVDDMLQLHYTGSNTEKAHPLIDYQNDRLYALGNSKYHCIDLTTFTEIWNTSIVANGGRDTRAGPVLVNDSFSGQYLTIFSTFPQVGTYAINFTGDIVWTWTTKTVRPYAAYNPNTGLIYLADSTGYSDAGGSLSEPGSIYGVYVNNGTTKWVTHGTGGGDKFARPITTSGNYIMWKTDNVGKNDYLYVGDATTGETLAKISAGADRGYWCYPIVLSGGYVATGGGYTSDGQIPGTDIYHIGDGDWVDSYPLHGNVNHTGYVENGLTSLGFTTETWEVRKVNETAITNNSLNGIEYEFSSYDLPLNFTWNIKVVQSDGQSAWGDENWNVRVLPVNQSPDISSPSPIDNAINVPLSLTQLSVSISDNENDLINWNIETSPDIGGSSGILESNGIKTCSVSGLSSDTTYTWFVNATDSLGSGGWNNVSFSFTTMEPGTWFDGNWMYRREIIINHSLVDDDLFNFTVLIDLTDSNVSDNAQPDGDDLLFTDYPGTQLNHEIELYNGTNGHLLAWVKVPFLSSSMDTILYMYYGNPASLNMENVAETWDDYFRMVQHLNETSGTHVDSTVYGNNGTNFGSTQDYIGIIDHGNSFNGTSDYIRVPTDNSIQFDEGSLTAETWIKPNTGNTNTRIINNRGKGAGGTVKGWQLKIAESAGKWKLKDAGIDDDSGNYKAYESTNTYSYNEWYHVVMVYEADNELRFYVNGVSDGSLSVGSYGNISNSLPTAIGASIATDGVEGTYDQFYKGGIDEIRLSNITRSSGWITTEYNNQYDPDSFFDIGVVEKVPSGDFVSPVISDVSSMISDPVDTDPSYGWENISCTVTDNMEVHSVYLNITYPDMHTENVSMVDGGGGQYYYNTTYTAIGSYSYFIWANDTSDNTDVSSSNVFEIPPNWDINTDHDCSIVDLVLVAGHFDETGSNGWIRADINNDGDVSIVDLVLVAGHFDETW
ncbi:DUF2341 domain-containing protein, partial [Thermoplasmatota archaeon]